MNATAHAAPLLRALVGLALVLLLTACPETTTDAGLGSAPQVLKTEDWNGTWMSVGDEEDATTLTLVNAATGELHMADKKKGSEDEKPTVLRLRQPTEAKDSSLFYVLIEDASTPTRKPSLYLLRAPEEGVLLMWTPNHEAIAQGIRDGELKGTTRLEKNDPQNHLTQDALNSQRLQQPRYWNWTQPVIARRKK